MFTSTLLCLLFVAGAHGDCVVSLQPAAVSRMRETAEPLSWSEMAAKCKQRGNSTLLQSHTQLNYAERMLCDDQLVPLGFFRDVDGKLHYQIGSFIDEHEPAPSRELLGEHDESLDEVASWEMGFAALDLSTGRWHLVSAETTFGCALCQSRPYKSLDDFSSIPSDEDVLTLFYRITLVAKGKARCGTVAGNEHVPAEELYEVLPHFDNIVDTSRTAQGFEFVVSVKSSTEEWDLDIMQDMEVFNKYLMTVTDASSCPESDDEDDEGTNIHCIERKIGELCVGAVSETRLRFSTRECKVDDANGRLVWSPPLVWQASTRPCSDLAQYASDRSFPYFTDPDVAQALFSTLTGFLYEPQDTYGMDRVADIVSRELRAANRLDQWLLDDLSGILLSTDLSWYAVSRPGAQLAVSSTRGEMGLAVGLALAWEDTDPEETVGDVWASVDADPEAYPEVLAEDVWSYPDVTASLVKEYHQVTVPRPQVTLALSPELLIAARPAVAFIALWPQRESVYESWQFGNHSLPRSLEVTMLVNARSMWWDIDAFVDVTYRRVARSVACAAWDSIAFAWDYGACQTLKSLSAANEACRCRIPSFEQVLEASVFRIALKTPVPELDMNVEAPTGEILNAR